MAHASRGRSVRTNNVNDHALKSQTRLVHKDADPQALLTPETVRRFIDAAQCPICGKGPYKVLSVHTNKAHGIDKFELRDMANLSTRDPITSLEYREQARQHALERGLGSKIDRKPKSGKIAPMRITKAGSERMAEKNRRWQSKLTPEERSERARNASLAVTEEGRRRAAAAISTRMKEYLSVPANLEQHMKRLRQHEHLEGSGDDTPRQVS